MVRHIVFLKLEDNSEKNKQIVKERMMQMQGNIDILKHIEVGINFSPEERAFDLVLITDFESKNDLLAYATHPVHVEVLKFLRSINTLSMVVDYEF